MKQIETKTYTLISDSEFNQLTFELSITGNNCSGVVSRQRPGHYYKEAMKLDFLDEILALKEVVDRAVEIARNAQEG